MMLTGAAMVLVGILVRRWASRYDLKDAALDSAWTLLRGRRTAENPTAIEAKLRDIGSESTWTGRVTKAAGTSPEWGSGSATTAHIATAGWARKASSTRPGSMLCEPRMITSLARPVTCRYPFAPMCPRSPHTSQPSPNRPALRAASV